MITIHILELNIRGWVAKQVDSYGMGTAVQWSGICCPQYFLGRWKENVSEKGAD